MSRTLEYVRHVVPGAFWKDEEEMVATQLTKWSEDERIQQLAGEIVIRAIQAVVS